MIKFIHTKAFNFLLGLIAMGIWLGTFYLLFVRGNLNDSNLSEVQRTELCWSVPWMAGNLLLLWVLSFEAINDKKFSWFEGASDHNSIYALFIIVVWLFGFENKQYFAFANSFAHLQQREPFGVTVYEFFEFCTIFYGLIVTFLIQRKILWDKKQMACHQLPEGSEKAEKQESNCEHNHQMK